MLDVLSMGVWIIAAFILRKGGGGEKARAVDLRAGVPNRAWEASASKSFFLSCALLFLDSDSG